MNVCNRPPFCSVVLDPGIREMPYQHAFTIRKVIDFIPIIHEREGIGKREMGVFLTYVERGFCLRLKLPHHPPAIPLQIIVPRVPVVLI